MRGIFLFAALCLFFAAATLIWLNLDRLPPNWDDAWYLANSLVLYDTLAQDGIAGFARTFQSLFGFKAPLIAALPAPFYLVFGRRWHAAYLVNIVSMLVLFAVVYQLARRWWSTRAALVAVTMVGCMPLLYGLARWFMVEYALSATLAAAVWLLVRSEGLERRGVAITAGVVCGLGLLLKITFAVFVLLPFLYVWMRSRRRLRGLALTMLPCVAIALPWYARHLMPTIENALSAGFGESAAIQGTGAVLTLQAITTYLLRVARHGLSDYLTILAIVLGVWMVSRRAGREFLRGAPGLVLLWMLPFAVFLFGGNKDVRYVAPILPAFALLSAAMLDFTLPRGRAGNALAVLLLAFPVLQMLSVSFGIPFHAGDLGYARRFDRRGWPLDEILNTIHANTSGSPRAKQLLLVGTDRAALNANNIELAAVANRLPFAVETTAHEKDWDTLLARLGQASFFVYKEGGEPESAASNPLFDQLVRRVNEDRRFREVPYGKSLPDGGVARIFQASTQHTKLTSRAFLRAGLEHAAEFAIDFGGMIELTGLVIAGNADSLDVKYRWRCRRPPDREYWCFTHVLDSEDKIVGQLDHQLLDGEPPLRSWQPGDGGLEEMRIPAPLRAEGLRLRVGMYDPRSGDRLRVTVPHGPATSKFVLTDQATAFLVGKPP